MTNENRKNGSRALVQVKEFLSELGWEPRKTELPEVFLVDFETDNIPIGSIHFDVRVDYERFLCYFNFKDQATAKSQKQVMEFVTRANSGLLVGNFEFNVESGFVCFKSSVDFTGIELSKTLIRNTLKSGMDAVEQYAEALVNVIRDNKGVIEAISDAEEDFPDRFHKTFNI